MENVKEIYNSWSKNNKLSVGDRVTVSMNMKPETDYSKCIFVGDMLNYRGEIGRIERITKKRYENSDLIIEQILVRFKDDVVYHFTFNWLNKI